MDISAFQPFLLTAWQRIVKPGEVEDSTRFPEGFSFSCLHVVLEGSLRDENLGEIKGGEGLFTPAGHRTSMEFSPGSYISTFKFDVVHQERHQTVVWHHLDGEKVQPPPEVWAGHDMPRFIPSQYLKSHIPTFRDIQENWWISDLEHGRANQWLGLFLIDWVRFQRIEKERKEGVKGTVGDLAKVKGQKRQDLYQDKRSQSPGQRLRQRRLNLAMNMKLSGRYTLAEIAVECGCSSASNLCRALKSYRRPNSQT